MKYYKIIITVYQNSKFQKKWLISSGMGLGFGDIKYEKYAVILSDYCIHSSKKYSHYYKVNDMN